MTNAQVKADIAANLPDNTSGLITPAKLRTEMCNMVDYSDTAAAAITLAGLGGVPTSRTVNGHALTGNVSVTASDVGLGSVENTALSTWTGSANLATVGTITTGTWHGAAIADAYIASAATWNAKVSFPGFGTTAGTAAKGNDVRLSDARTPLAHNQAWSTITSTPTTLSGYGITDAQSRDTDLTALAGLSTTGLVARTGAGTAATRTITGTANQVTVTNGDGVAGNPTLELPQSIATTSTPQFSGLRIASSVTVDGGVVSVNANAVGSPTPAIDAWTDNGTTQANISATTYGISGGGIFHGRMARGNQASPSQALAGDIIGGIGGRAWESGTNGFQNSSPASIHFVASEDQSSSTRGSYLRFLTTPNGSGTRQERLLITPNGMVVVTDTVADNFNWNTFAGFGPAADDVGLLVLSGVGGARSPNATIATLSTAGSGGGTTSGFRGFFSGGTPSAPLATPSGKILSFLGGAGHNGSAWTATKAGVFVCSSEDWTTTGNGAFITLETTQSGTTNRAQRLVISGDGALRLNAYGAGTLTTDSSGNVTASSDSSLKTVTGPFIRGLADVLKLTPRTYRWNEKSGMDTEDENVGFIAQEVLDAVPEAVGQYRTSEVEVDGKKTKKREKAELLTLSDRPLIAALVNAVKELKAENDALSARIAKLEGKK